jgi:hypothetical protein
MPSSHWLPDTLTDLESALNAGVLKETHYFDHKERLPPPGEKTNHNLAVDLASLAVDGGTIFVGVREDRRSDRFSLAPFRLEGAAERLEQIARYRLDPPLSIRCIPLRASPTDQDGCLVVQIPESPDAPHMVGNIYRGRGEKTNIELGDSQVWRTKTQRDQARRESSLQLDDWVTQDPFPSGKHVHLFCVAEPISAKRGQLLSAVDGDWNQLFQTALLAGEPFGQRDLQQLGLGNPAVPRPHGRALVSYALDSMRRPAEGVPSPEDYASDLEVRENGGVRFFAGRVSDSRSRMGATADEELVERLFGSLVQRFTTALLHVVSNVASAAHYSGSWYVGLGLQPMRGVRIWTIGEQLWRSPPPRYPDDGYREELTVSGMELENARSGIVESLLGRLWRAMGTTYAQVDAESRQNR